MHIRLYFKQQASNPSYNDTMTQQSEVPVRILIINPNTSTHMTDALKPAVEGLGYQNVSP